MDDVERASGLKLSDYAGASVNSGYGAYPVYLAKLSQVNAALELAGRPALELGAGECAVFSDSDITSGFYRDAVDRGTVLSVGGRDLRVAEFRGESLQTTPFPMNTGTLVVPTRRCRQDRRSSSPSSTCSAQATRTRPRSAR